MTYPKRVQIIEGDIVNVEFTRSSSLFGYEVIYMPVETGDSWILAHPVNGDVRYVQIFEQIQLIRRKEDNV